MTVVPFLRNFFAFVVFILSDFPIIQPVYTKGYISHCKYFMG